jgi:hypothetical protein
MMPIPLEYQKSVLYGSIVVGAFIAAFVLQAILPSTFAAAGDAIGASVAQAPSGTVYLQGDAVPSPTAVNVPAQLTIADNGFIHLGGARITALRDGSITAQLNWSSAQLTWQIDGSSAKFYGHNGETIDASAIHVGDVVSVSGTIAGGSQIDAQYVRLQK